MKKDDMVMVTELCVTRSLWGLVGKIVRKPRNKHYIVKFPRDIQLYIFSESELVSLKERGI